MSQTIYRYDPVTGIYTETIEWTPPYPGIALPGNATLMRPPSCETGSVAVYRSGEWLIEEDHRGETVYDIATAAPVIITALGPLPDGVTRLVPPDFPVWLAGEWGTDEVTMQVHNTATIRAERDRRLQSCDWTQLPDAALTDEQVTEWATYRQALRDITEQGGFPWGGDIDAVPWPDIPVSD